MARYKDTDYLGISTRIHAMETHMLTHDRLERLLDAKDLSDAYKVLEECDYAEPDSSDPKGLEHMISDARSKTFDDIKSAVSNHALVEVFQIPYDYHNAKVLIKSRAMGTNAEPLLLAGGRFDITKLQDHFAGGDLRDYPETFRVAVSDAQDAISEVGDPQQADFILDKAAYTEMVAAANESSSEYLQGYVRLLIDAANLKTAVRCSRLSSGSALLGSALIPGGNVDAASLMGVQGEDLKALFRAGLLADAAEIGGDISQGGKGSMSEVEKLCDNAVVQYLSTAKRLPFGEPCVVYYLYAKEAEMNTVRTVMSCRAGGLDADSIRTYLRDSCI